MLYLLSVLMPPLAVSLAGKPRKQVWLSMFLTLTAWVPGVIHALFMTEQYYQEQKRQSK